MDLSLSGKTAFVGGASRGIGAAAAVELATLGARVILASRGADALEKVLETLPGEGHQVVACDYDRPDAAMETIAQSVQQPVHIVINNAGGPPGGPLIDAAPEAFLATFQRHLIMNHRLLQLFRSSMKNARYGRVINIISTSVYEPITGLGVSNTIRGAVASWAKTLATELGPEQITVNNVLPGFTDTQRLQSLIAGRAEKAGVEEATIADQMRSQVPLGRFANAGETAAMIAFLASPAGGYISGQSIAVDGGRTRSI